MKFKFAIHILFIGLLASCKNDKPLNSNTLETTKEEEATPEFINKGHELVFNMVEKVGNYNNLKELKDVVYTYTYQTPDGKTDSSTEKYIFDGELSYGAYTTHERTLANLKGTIEQGYDGKGYWLKHKGDTLNDDAYLKRVAFNRPTNFYWFTMFQKMLDPGLNYEFIEETTIDNKNYDVVKVSFDLDIDKPTDIYQLYINQDTNVVDQFLFTVADFGKMETPSLMLLEYEKIDGLLMPTKRKYKRSNWNAEVDENPWIMVNWSDIQFNTNLTKEDFKI